jgi:hypothetical protein
MGLWREVVGSVVISFLVFVNGVAQRYKKRRGYHHGGAKQKLLCGHRSNHAKEFL